MSARLHTVMLEALAPLVFRSGKPFGSQYGADGAAFPLPSSAAGLLRTLHADQAGAPFDAKNAEQLRELSCQGPLLARRRHGKRLQFLLPRPADALYMRDGDNRRVLRLEPRPLAADCGCDLHPALLPLQMQQTMAGKPADGPQFWALEHLTAWQAGKDVDYTDLKAAGQQALADEVRTHVGLDDHSLASDEGLLFQTGGIDLAPARVASGGIDLAPACVASGGWGDAELVFIARTSASVAPTLATFGGERRLSRLSAAPDNSWPVAPAGLDAAIRAAGGLCLTLATPAIFSGGHIPGWLDADTLEGSPPGMPGLRLRLRAAAVERWLPVSGWDLQRNSPKAMRKAVAAGAVYWFQIIAASPPDIAAKLWLAPLSDHLQDARDGFGLALPAAWQAA
ncbi:MAG: hypothetical protein JNJ60_16985 [Rhodocyclaceae bacterium]|nr:hypothetical protein [Rhodocyclaceae bacterium]